LTKKKPREIRLWQFDPSVFQPGPKAGFVERYLLQRARSLAKYTFYTLAFAYPILLVTLGIVFGGLVFWPSLAGSMMIIWLVIKKAGYSENFASWDIGYKKFVGLIGAFGMFAAFVYGLRYIGLMTVPVFGGILVIALILGIWTISKQ
jgi:hypothetical protein